MAGKVHASAGGSPSVAPDFATMEEVLPRLSNEEREDMREEAVATRETGRVELLHGLLFNMDVAVKREGEMALRIASSASHCCHQLVCGDC